MDTSMDVVKASQSAAMAQTKQAIIARALIGAAFPAPSRVFAGIGLQRGILVGSLVNNGRGQGVQIAWPLRHAPSSHWVLKLTH
jgi:hypothetical protein